MRGCLQEDYKKSVEGHNRDNMQKRQNDLNDEQLANMRVNREVDVLKQMEQSKKVFIKNMLQSDADERKKYHEYESLLREH